MSGKHIATVRWERGDQPFVDNKYSRAHRWEFDGGAVVRGSPAPSVVKEPMSDPAGVDPEEAFVASLSSCHMLFFLAYAATRKFRVDSYIDNAEGVLDKDAEGRMAMTRVTLRPSARFSGELVPSPQEIERLHHDAHEKCFIANSVKTEVLVEPAAA
jgi:organic hydroperoxide reductase OsmC/OhrA